MASFNKLTSESRLVAEWRNSLAPRSLVSNRLKELNFAASKRKLERRLELIYDIITTTDISDFIEYAILELHRTWAGRKSLEEIRALVAAFRLEFRSMDDLERPMTVVELEEHEAEKLEPSPVSDFIRPAESQCVWVHQPFHTPGHAEHPADIMKPGYVKVTYALEDGDVLTPLDHVIHQDYRSPIRLPNHGTMQTHYRVILDDADLIVTTEALTHAGADLFPKEETLLQCAFISVIDDAWEQERTGKNVKRWKWAVLPSTRREIEPKLDLADRVFTRMLERLKISGFGEYQESMDLRTKKIRRRMIDNAIFAARNEAKIRRRLYGA